MFNSGSFVLDSPICDCYYKHLDKEASDIYAWTIVEDVSLKIWCKLCKTKLVVHRSQFSMDINITAKREKSDLHKPLLDPGREDK